MKCEDLLSELETGGALRRMRARRHAARCPKCAGVYAAFLRVKQQLARPEPLSLEARRVWEQVSGAAAGEAEDGVRVGSLGGCPRNGGLRLSRRWLPVASGLVAACLVLSLLGRFMLPRPTSSGPVPPPGEVTVEMIDPAVELAAFSASVGRLQEQVERLKEQAARRQARQAVALVLNRYGEW